MRPDTEIALAQLVETNLGAEYQFRPELTDALCVIGLDNSIIALKHAFGFARNETVLSRPVIDGIVAHVVDIGVDSIGNLGDVTLKDYIAVIHKIKKSVIRQLTFGPRAYYDFIKNYV